MRCEPAPFRAFLAAAARPIEPDFPRLALGHALRRQAIGAAQHRDIDVFQPIAQRWNLADIPTLSELAEILFGDV
jgi:hypothetical protein